MSKLANVETAVIAITTSLSAAVNLGNKRLAAIQMPAAWDAAVITFQGSLDGTTFSNLFDSNGLEMSIPSLSATANLGISIDVASFAGWPFLKIRSGTAASPVNQTAARSLLIASIELIGG